LSFRQIVDGGDVHSLALDRLHDEGGHVARAQLLFLSNPMMPCTRARLALMYCSCRRY
jgi:hypothetical protein